MTYIHLPESAPAPVTVRRELPVDKEMKEALQCIDGSIFYKLAEKHGAKLAAAKEKIN